MEMTYPAASYRVSTVIPDTRFLEYKLDPESSLRMDSRLRENDVCKEGFGGLNP